MTGNNTRCPCCGGEMNAGTPVQWLPQGRTFIANGRAANFTHREARAFDALWKARQRGGGVTTPQMVEVIYYDDPNGGPTCETISVYIHKMRRALRGTGWIIVTERRGPHSPALYRLTQSTEVFSEVA